MTIRAMLIGTTACIPTGAITAGAVLTACVATAALAEAAAAQTPPAKAAAVKPRAAAAAPAAPSSSSATPAAARQAESSGRPDDIIVVGRPTGSETPQTIRRDSLQVVDSISIQDPGARGQINAGDILKNVPGVQTIQDQGEGGNVLIRGLAFTQTLIDGRQIMTSTARSLSIGEVAAEVLRGVDIYKSPSANLVDGGIGGVVNLRTAQPPLAKGWKFYAALRENIGENSKRGQPGGGARVSGRFDTPLGEMGIVAGIGGYSFAYTNADIYTATYNPVDSVFDVNRDGIVGTAAVPQPADQVFIPYVNVLNTIPGIRDRRSILFNASLKPSPQVELHANFVGFRYSDQQFIQNYTPYLAFGIARDPTAPLTTVTADGRTFLRQGTLLNVPVIPSGSYNRVLDETNQVAAGGSWSDDRTKLSLEGDYTHGTASSDYRQVELFGFLPKAVFTLRENNFWDIAFPGTTTTSPAGLSLANYKVSRTRTQNTQYSGRFDVARRMDGFVQSLQAGVRYTNRTANSATLAFTTIPLTGAADSVPGLLTINANGYLPDEHPSTPHWIVPDPRQFADEASLRRRLGLGPVLPSTPTNSFRFDERTYAGYVRGLYQLDIGSVAVTGDVGVRIIRTDTVGSSFLVEAGGLPVARVAKGSRTDVLPSATLRAAFTPLIIMKLSASKSVTPPNFGDLSPALTLNPLGAGGGAGGVLRTGSGGNPDLKPFDAFSLDGSLEWYWGARGYMTISPFYKKVDGLIESAATIRTINGEQFQIFSPINAGKGTIKGIELFLQRKLDFLPGALSNLGFSASYTYIDAKNFSNVQQRDIPILQVSKNIYNLIGWYATGGLNLSVSYYFRDRFATATTSADALNAIGYSRSDPFLEAYAGYTLPQGVTIFARGTNLNKLFRGQYYGSPVVPNNHYFFERRFEVGMNFDF